MARHLVYIGTYSKGEGNGVFRGLFDESTGELSILDSIAVDDPSYLKLSEDGKILYGVSETESFQNGSRKENGGGLFAISLPDGELLSMECTHGAHPCHLCACDDHIFVANYTGGSLSIFEAMENGGVASLGQSIQLFGESVNKERQDRAHPHFSAMTPDGRYLSLCDLGQDQVILYPYSQGGLSTRVRRINCPAGSGPRHLIYSRDGKYLYVLTELHSSVLVFEYNDGNCVLAQELSALPSDYTGESYAAAIHLSPCGGYLAASNRGHDSIALFRIQPNGGLLSAGFIMTGAEPRDFMYSPGGEWILSANQKDNSVTVHRVRHSLSELASNASGVEEEDAFVDNGTVSLPSPVCIVFGEEA